MDDELEQNRRFLLEVEQGIRLANKEVIHTKIPPVTAERMLSLAISVAKLRLNYIEGAFTFVDAKSSSGHHGEEQIKELRLHRECFEEARNAYVALQRAIEIGYIATE